MKKIYCKKCGKKIKDPSIVWNLFGDKLGNAYFLCSKCNKDKL